MASRAPPQHTQWVCAAVGQSPPPHTWARTSHWAAEPPTGRPVLRSRQSEAQPSLHAECRPWWPHVSMTPRGSGTQRLGT